RLLLYSRAFHALPDGGASARRALVVFHSAAGPRHAAVDLRARRADSVDVARGRPGRERLFVAALRDRLGGIRLLLFQRVGFEAGLLYSAGLPAVVPGRGLADTGLRSAVAAAVDAPADAARRAACDRI